MDMQLRVVVKRVDILAVYTCKIWCQVMTDHRGDLFTAAPAGIEVAVSMRTVAQPDDCRDKFGMGMVAVLGVKVKFLQRYLEVSAVDTFDKWHWRAVFGLIEWRRIL